MAAPYFEVREPYAADAPIVACPVAASLGVLGRKWALPILRDVAHRSNVRFSDLLHHNQGLTPRALSAILKELQRDDLIVRIPSVENKREAFYDLTSRGRDVIPILTALVGFAIRNLPEKVFADGKARTLDEILPNSAETMLGPLLDYARAAEGRPQILDRRGPHVEPRTSPAPRRPRR